jgi:hypothetical protein
MDSFFTLMKPDVMKLAVEAFREEWHDFFLRLGQEVQAKIIAEAQTLWERMQRKGLEQLERMSGATADLMGQMMEAEVDGVVRQLEKLKALGATTQIPARRDLEDSTADKAMRELGMSGQEEQSISIESSGSATELEAESGSALPTSDDPPGENSVGSTMPRKKRTG